MNQIHYAILDHNDRYYTLSEIKRYIEIKIIHVQYYYENGVEKKNLTYAPVRDCIEKDFTKNN